MGGSKTYNPADYIKPPDSTLPMEQLKQYQQLGSEALRQRTALLEQQASMPLEQWTPDLFSPQGALTKASMIAATNALKSKQLEQEVNPAAAKAREQLMQRASDFTSPDYWRGQMDNWARSRGLSDALRSGTGGSSFGQSAFADRATQQGQQFDLANLQAAQNIIGQAPTAGIDPGQAIAQLQAAEAKAVQDRMNYKNAVAAGAAGQQQTTMDWINSMMGSTSKMLGARDQSWQNYQQGMMQGAANNAASANAAKGAAVSAGIGAAGLIAAVAI
jgi:hypothetical protein